MRRSARSSNGDHQGWQCSLIYAPSPVWAHHLIKAQSGGGSVDRSERLSRETLRKPRLAVFLQAALAAGRIVRARVFWHRDEPRNALVY
jgi:hypothetical protein